MYKLSHDTCIKIYRKRGDAREEAKALKHGAGTNYLPELYKTGRNYNVMEYIDGKPLDVYLKQRKVLSKVLAKELVLMLKVLEHIQFNRIDARLRHIFVKDDQKIKVIDHVSAFRYKTDYPIHLYRGLKKLGHLPVFLQQLEELDPDLFKRWEKARMLK